MTHTTAENAIRALIDAAKAEAEERRDQARVLEMFAAGTGMREEIAKCKASATTWDKLASEAELGLALIVRELEDGTGSAISLSRVAEVFSGSRVTWDEAGNRVVTPLGYEDGAFMTNSNAEIIEQVNAKKK